MESSPTTALSAPLAAPSSGGFFGWVSENKQGITLAGCVLVLLGLAAWYIWQLKRDQEEKIKHIKRKMTKTAHEYAEKRLAKEIAAKSADSAAGTPTTFQQQQQLMVQQQQQQFLLQQQQQQQQQYAYLQAQAQARAQAQAQPEAVDPAALANTMAYLAANPEALAAAMKQQQQQSPEDDGEDYGDEEEEEDEDEEEGFE
ncbi:hypothetical protein QKT49_gp430 [Acanthamoeba castellanii medusavirus]|uniref:Uncharacterized protein n=1 Tax=Acanthamoeba castellanii medusavirus J1 TaxID=3114988 RepID=A0A3T1CWX5_9VIRU|nr:hypothetical protein QKT49_gp430 [Acanthamoeba castellanii medusavirus]BBI30333.1 hypothetical protein [Acanthamoeba castellanii medusavirus J1]